MASSNKHIVFDVVGKYWSKYVSIESNRWEKLTQFTGTLVSYENFFEAIEERMGERLKTKNIGSRIFGFA
jgi:2-haloacid dehalogenase